jgi:hypothetical protein
MNHLSYKYQLIKNIDMIDDIKNVILYAWLLQEPAVNEFKSIYNSYYGHKKVGTEKSLLEHYYYNCSVLLHNDRCRPLQLDKYIIGIDLNLG